MLHQLQRKSAGIGADTHQFDDNDFTTRKQEHAYDSLCVNQSAVKAHPLTASCFKILIKLRG